MIETHDLEIVLARFVLANFEDRGAGSRGCLFRPLTWPADWLDHWAVLNRIAEKHAYYILQKWDGGLWNSGVTTRSGWVEDVEKLREIAAERQRCPVSLS